MSGDGSMFSKSAWEKFVEMWKFYQRVRHQYLPQPRRRVISGGGGAADLKTGTIIQTLSYFENDDVDHYLVGITTAAAYSATKTPAYASGDLVSYPTTAGAIYKANKASSDPAGVWVAADWDVVIDDAAVQLKIDKAIGYEGTTDDDLRNHIPWFQIDAIVPLVKIGSKWFIDLTLTPCGDADNCSIRWNETDKRAMAVFK